MHICNQILIGLKSFDLLRDCLLHFVITLPEVNKRMLLDVKGFNFYDIFRF